jgi:hypothetical protein
MTAQYTYLATDLVTNAILGELPVNNVSLDCQLNSAGNLSAGMRLSDPRLENDDAIARTEPGKTAFWAIRENTVVWGGCILSREYQSDGKSVSLTGQTFECYAARRFPQDVIANAIQNLSLGQGATIDYLWSQLQSCANGSIGVAPANVPLVDPATTLTITGSDLSTSYGDLITSVTGLAGGPDYTIAWGIDQNGNLTKQLVVGTPIGNALGATDLTIDYPGPVKNYTYTENSSSGSNRWYAVGDGGTTTAVMGVSTDENSLASGYPLWCGVNNYSGVTVQSTINAHSASDLASSPMPLVTHAAELAGNGFPEFGSYGMGDYVVVNITDPRFKGGFTFNVRAIGWSIQPPDEGQGVETINLVFDESTGSGG